MLCVRRVLRLKLGRVMVTACCLCLCAAHAVAVLLCRFAVVTVRVLCTVCVRFRSRLSGRPPDRNPPTACVPACGLGPQLLAQRCMLPVRGLPGWGQGARGWAFSPRPVRGTSHAHAVRVDTDSHHGTGCRFREATRIVAVSFCECVNVASSVLSNAVDIVNT